MSNSGFYQNKLILDDNGMALLGNALLLGYLFIMVERRGRERSEEDNRLERIEYSERRELREILQLAGAFDEKLQGATNPTKVYETISFPEYNANIVRLTYSDEPMAKLRLSDLQIPEALAQKNELEQIIGSAHPYDIRRPLAFLGPTELTRSVKKLVVEYFNSANGISIQASPQGLQFGVHQSGDKTNHQFFKPDTPEEKNSSRGGGPRTGKEVGSEKFAADCLKAIATDNPTGRLTKSDAMKALTNAGYSKKASDRIWAAGTPDHWKEGGRFEKDQLRLLPDDLEAELTRNKPPQFP